MKRLSIAKMIESQWYGCLASAPLNFGLGKNISRQVDVDERLSLRQFGCIVPDTTVMALLTCKVGHHFLEIGSCPSIVLKDSVRGMTTGFRNMLLLLDISNDQSAFPLMMDARSEDAIGLLRV
ncbi:hypothetical protein [Brucella sp. NBRC 12950]|uniref:hypothetical protein n=1 Tax=Brucella sp. NBRC 12950 TaxID=2994518 RepID=UPI0025529FB1|nr:hypothetical protein [Brucella sp. NBRC 12950]